MMLTVGFRMSRYLLCLLAMVLIGAGSFAVLFSISEGNLPDTGVTSILKVPFRVLAWPALYLSKADNWLIGFLLTAQVLIYPLIAERIIFVITRKK